jgi:beta-lactamase class A
VRRHAILAVLIVVIAMSGPALAGDRDLLKALDGGLAPTASASRAAAGGSPSLVQRHYERARALQEAVRLAAPFSTSCHALGGWAARYAAAEVAAAEGLDRLQPARAARFRQVAASARARIAATRRACRPGPPRRPIPIPALLEPRPGAVTFGAVVARAPSSADAATLYSNGAAAGPLALGGGLARARLVGLAGRYNLEVRFTRAGTTIAVARSAGVWLLPESAGDAARPPEMDPTWQARVRAAASAFAGISAVWVHDLRTGRAASWNAAARFPAASTVKLGAIVEALRRMGPQPEASALFHDVRGIATWSSNLASNRLLGRVGGSGAVQGALARMGATSSTFTGPYIVATERPPVDSPTPPPRVSGRVTTAYDLGVVMRTLHDAARGNADALARTRMSTPQARLALGLLLSSEAAGDNLGLFREALGPSVPAAQKQGWISSARHSAAVVYTGRGPVVVVVLTYQPGLTRARAARLGADLVTIATSAP